MQDMATYNAAYVIGFFFFPEIPANSPLKKIAFRVPGENHDETEKRELWDRF